MKNKEKVKKPIYKRVWFWIVIVVVAVAVIAQMGGDSTENTTSSNDIEPIEYTAVSVDKMMEDLSTNAAAAADAYDDQYVEITGRLSVIDSNGSYISLYPQNDQWAITGVQCSIETEEQLGIVKTLQKEQTVTVRGKITGVGEVLGYTLDIDTIVQ